jgi:hypothetical protein
MCVMQEARLTELKKEVDTLREELKASTDAVSVLNVSLGAAEEFVSKPPSLPMRALLSMWVTASRLPACR